MAIGDRINIADKETLNLVGSNVEELHSKVGTTADKNGTEKAGTVFGKLNGIFGYVNALYGTWSAYKASHLDAAISSRQSESNAVSRYNTLNTNTAADSTPSATGTLSQKLSYIINALVGQKPKYPRSYRVEHTATSGSYVTIVNVSGPGFLDAISTNAHDDSRISYIQVVADGVDVTPISTSSGVQWVVRYLDSANTGIMNSVTNPAFEKIRPLHFSKSLVIRVCNDDSSDRWCNVDYAVYE